MTAMDLATRYETLRTAAPQLRVRDAAAQLGVTEAELVVTVPTAIQTPTRSRRPMPFASESCAASVDR